MLFVGGYKDGRALASAELFDSTTATFTPTGSMLTARLKFTAAPLRDGSVIVLGGAGDIEGRSAFATTEIYSPLTGRFRDGPGMNEPRYKLEGSTVVLRDGAVFVAGGAARPEILSSAADAFTSIPGSLGGTRLFLAAAATGDSSVLITAGYDNQIVPTPQAWIYRPSP